MFDLSISDKLFRDITSFMGSLYPASLCLLRRFFRSEKGFKSRYYTFFRKATFKPLEYAKMGWRYFLSSFSVNHYHVHWFSVGKWPLIFINFQTFLDNHKPCSAAKDFQLT